MLGVLRRRVVSGGSSASILGHSLLSIRPVAKSEILLQTKGGLDRIRNLSHLIFAGSSPCSRTTRNVGGYILPEPIRQMWSRFNYWLPCDAGDMVDAFVPFMGESITDGTLAKFLKIMLSHFLYSPGDRVAVDEPIAQVETDKDFNSLIIFQHVTIDVTSPESGVIQKFVANEGDTVEPGTKIAVISKSGEGVDNVSPSEKTSEIALAQPSPPVEKIRKTPSSPPPKPSAREPQLYSKERERRIPMTRLRRRVSIRLKDSQNTFAMLTTFNEVDMTNLMKLRSEYKDAFVEKHGVKLGLMSGFIKAAVSGLQNQPTINAVIDGDDIICRDYIDISIAVGTPKGLVVPVIRNADKMNFAEIEKEINTLAKKANDGSISIDEMAGGTFTISNGGVYGSLLSTPIINRPQSAILSMHSIVNRPMVVGGNIVPRPMMYVALTYDHRLIDGREAVYFLRRIKDVVEDPRRLLDSRNAQEHLGSGASILPLTLSASLLYISVTRILLTFPSRMEPAMWWPDEQEAKHEKVGEEAAERKGWDEKLEEEMKGVLGMVREKDGAETRDHFEKESSIFHKTQDSLNDCARVHFASTTQSE
ncbi:dihydrolipoyllysine-residue succinyltransferase component protein [Pyrus ussuriensis x Pyrus communis]|uniref:dihydrolipoyllysine-residue succinyltransferase n=1 Tax=Pyrus ussuriensis x Pyrus communis TaxID=2448454 RepID=A0A5N5GPR1_9ROSA|nr:dihydrolipoyllysine-residue succinyltransferase component protein [Pyrus ussuriensis x Pyrus communis]